jgi:hypothetical protein
LLASLQEFCAIWASQWLLGKHLYFLHEWKVKQERREAGETFDWWKGPSWLQFTVRFSGMIFFFGLSLICFRQQTGEIFKQLQL